MNSKIIQKRLWNRFRSHNYKLSNVFVFDWESDFFSITKSGYCYEIEIKISKADFKADFNKMVRNTRKHEFLLKYDSIFKPNKFFFAFPVGLIDYNEIPLEYGIIEIDETSSKLVRDAKFLHKEQLLGKVKFLRSLLDKFYWRNIQLRNALEKRDFDLKFEQKTIPNFL